MPDYYDGIAPGYDELYREEQLSKLILILDRLQVTKEDSVLDVGCGTAFSFELLHPIGCRFQGLEPSQGLIDQSRYPKKITKCKAEDMPFPPNLFTVIISVTALQNFDDPRKGLEQMKRVCKGKLAITFLKKSPKREELDALLNEIFAVEQVIEEEKDVMYFCSTE